MSRALLVLAVLAVCAAGAAATERAGFLAGTYAAGKGCEMLAKIEAGGPRTVETVPETLDADGFHGWEGECDFTKVFEHEPGKVWIGLMVCVEGAQFTPETYLFMKSEADDSFEVAAQNQELPELYSRCTGGKGK